MSYSNETLDRALDILARRREKAEYEAEARFDEISESIPELADIKNKLSQIGFNISKVFLYSKDKQTDIDKLMQESLKLQKKREELLAQHGYDCDALEVKYTCAECSDTGFIGNRRCKCHKELLKSIEREKLQKIAPLDRCTFESFNINYYPEKSENGISPRLKAEKIKASCFKYAINFTTKSSNILFMGGTGLGKTHLSLAIANVAINRGYSIIYGTSQNILTDLQNENFGRTNSLRYTENDILNCDLLIIDDLGTEFVNNYSVACLYNIVNTRLSANLPTIISTNFSTAELEEKYDQRITSRITGEYNILSLIGNDIRYIK